MFTVRSDFYGELLQDRQLLDRLLDGKVDLGPMTSEEWRQAITRPASSIRRDEQKWRRPKQHLSLRASTRNGGAGSGCGVRSVRH